MFAARFADSECATQKRWAENVAHRSHRAQDLQFSAQTHSIRNRNRPAKQVGDSTLVEPTFNEQGLNSTIGSVCRVRQSGMPNEPRRAPPS